MLKLLLPLTVCFCKGNGDATATHRHIFIQIGREKQVLNCFFFLETLHPVKMSLFFTSPHQKMLPSLPWLSVSGDLRFCIFKRRKKNKNRTVRCSLSSLFNSHCCNFVTRRGAAIGFVCFRFGVVAAVGRSIGAARYF